jgi:TldD protein
MEYESLLKKAVKLGADYADLRIADFNVQNIISENSSLSSVQNNDLYSYGVRAFIKGAWGTSFGNDITNLEKSIKTAVKLAKLSSGRINEKFDLKDFPVYRENVKSKAKIDPRDISVEEKIKHVIEYDKNLNEKPVVSRTISLGFVSGTNEFYNTDGSEIKEEKLSLRFYAQIAAKEGNKIQKAFDRRGLMAGYERFERMDTNKFCSDLKESVKRLLHAEKAPAGKMPIVIDPVLCHVFFHEAVGHACEADAILEKVSVLRGKLGKKIAPDFLTLSDNPNVPEENGFYKYDSEGMRGKEAMLIKKGILSEFMNSRETASKMNAKPNGHGRAENPSMMPCPRMSNTVLYPGKYKFEELLENIKHGVYAKGSSGGVVNPVDGNFLFNSQEAFLIENGKLTRPLIDVSFGGNILDTLKNVEKIGRDQIPCLVGGYCGKKGQLVPVCGKTPSIKISEAIVGGANK